MSSRIVRLCSPTSFFSPLAASALRPLPASKGLFRFQQLPRAMATSTPTTEWLAVIPDFPNATAKRLEVRPTHFADLEVTKSTGVLKFGGAVLNDKPSDPSDPKTYDFAGSTLIVLADSKQDVIDFLKKDVYARERVWDVDNAQIYALRTAFRIP